MSTSSSAPMIGTIGRTSTRRARRSVRWLAALLVALAVATVTIYLVHRSTTSTDAPPATQQQAVPQERVAPASKHLLQINDQPGADAVPVPPQPRYAPSRLALINQ